MPPAAPSARAQGLIDAIDAYSASAEMKLKALFVATDLIMPGSAVILAAHARQGSGRVSVEAARQPPVPVRPSTPEPGREPFSETDVRDIFAVLAGTGFANLESGGAVLVMNDALRSVLGGSAPRSRTA